MNLETDRMDRSIQVGSAEEPHWSGRLLRDRRLLLLILGLVAVAGFSSLIVLPRMEDPVLVPRAAVINTLLPGADAARVESLVTEKIEDRLRDCGEIKELRSQSRSGISTVAIELQDSVTEAEVVWAKIRGRMEDAIADLPPQAGRPELKSLEVRAFAKLVSVVWDPATPVDYSVLRRTAKDLQDLMQNVPGTEKVERFGDPGEEILVQVDLEQAASIGLSAADISGQLSSFDAKDAAGQIRGSKLDLAVELGNQFSDLASIEETQIRGQNGIFVRLASLATVELVTPQPMAQKSLHRTADLNHAAAITVGALIRPEWRIDRWTVAIDQQLDAFASRLPAGMKLVDVLDQNTYVADRLSNLMWNLILGGLAVVLVVWGMMGFRSSIIVASALPLTMLTVLFAMRGLDIPIHQMSITGLIIALGLLIDNAIVVADEVKVEMEHGASPAVAVQATVKKLTIPLLGSSLTTVFAFAPIALMPGPAGEFVSSIAYSVMLAILASLVFSLTVVASLAAIFLRVQSAAVQQRTGVAAWLARFWRQGFSSESLASAYRQFLLIAMRRPVLSMLGSLSIPMLGFALFTQLPEQFFPPADRDQFRIDIELATGASLEDTERIVQRVGQQLAEHPIRQVDWYLGESAPTFYYNLLANRKGQPNFAQAIVQVDDVHQVGTLIGQLQRELDQQIPEARLLVRQLEQGPPFEAPLEVRLYGPDLAKLTEIGEEIRSTIAALPMVTHTRSLLGENATKINVDVDAQSASLAGLTPRAVQTQVQASLDGLIAGSVIQETEQLPVRVRTLNDRRSELSGLRELDLVVGEGESRGKIVPLRAVAEVRLESEPGVIVRFNRRRMNEICAYLQVGVLPALALDQFQQGLAANGFELPEGYSMEFGGEAAKRNDAVGNLMASVGILLALMIATLVLSFSSFRLAAIIGLVGFFSVGLGMGSLYLGGYPFGFMAIIGTMGLVGVAINDSIVVLATLQETYGRVSPTTEEIVDTVMKCTRHVLATTFTTVAGFVPLVWAGGQFWPPLAVAISGGVVGATLLALVFVPIAFRWAYCRASVTHHTSSVARDITTGCVGEGRALQVQV